MSTELDRPEVKTTEETQADLQKQEHEDAPPPTEKVEVAVNPRIHAERELAKAAAARREAEAKERIPGMEDTPQVVPAEETPAPAVEATPAPTEAASPTEGPIDPNSEVDILVDGKPMKVKASQILDYGKRAMQKEIAADTRLQLASELLAEAKRRLEGQPSAPADAQPKPAPAPVQTKSDAELAKLLQFGSQEEAAQAIAEIRRRDAGAVTPDGLQDLIAKQLPAAVSSQLAFHTAVTQAKEKYADIFADPHLTTLFHVEEHRARQAGDARPHADLYSDIGDRIRAHFKLKAPTPNPGPSLEQKREAKAATPSVPRLASVRIDSAGGPAKSPTEVREEVLEKMRKQRGQGTIRKY